MSSLTDRKEMIIMMTPTTCTRPGLLKALLLTMALTPACQGENPDLAPAVLPPAVLPEQPLIPFAHVALSGVGTYENGKLRRTPTYETCASSTPSCVTWTAPLPEARPGYELRVHPSLPIPLLVGASVVTSQPGKTCEELLRVQVQVSTDLDPQPVDLIGTPITVQYGAARIAVTACAYGSLDARLGPLTGAASYVPSAP